MGETHLKSHPALWSHLWSSSPCLFVCFCHESPPPSLLPLRLFSPSLPVFSLFCPLLLDVHVAFLLSGCGQFNETKGRTRVGFPAARPARRAGSLSVPVESCVSSLPLPSCSEQKTHREDKARSALCSCVSSSHSFLGCPLHFSFYRDQFVNRSRLM